MGAVTQQAKIGRVYVVEHVPTRRRYVGYTGRTIAVRWAQHCRSGLKSKYPLGRAIASLGPEQFTVQQVYQGPRAVALEIEKGLIEAQNLTNPERGFNAKDGGAHPAMSAQTRARMSESANKFWSDPKNRKAKGESSKRLWSNSARRQAAAERMTRRWENADETERRKMSPFIGRRHTAESREKMSKQLRGRGFSLEHCANISKGKKGRKQHSDAVAKRAAAQTGAKRSAETRANISAALKGRRFSTDHCEKLSAIAKARPPRKRNASGQFV